MRYLLAIVLLLCACGSSTVSGQDIGVIQDGIKPDIVDTMSADLLPSIISASKACNDMADLLGDLWLGCSGDETEAKKFASALKSGWDCDNVLYLDDAMKFYKECIPEVKKLTCKEIAAGDAPEPCWGQFILQ